MNENLLQVKSEITKVLRGKEDCIDQILCCMLAGGHILLEDIPGVGKTTLAVALSRAMSLHYKRMQFTPDVLPSDILGFSLLDTKTGEFVYRPGAIFTNIFLADEINRTSPKTQSALLEVMEEGKVTVDQITHELPKPFVVIATQNPVGSAGTSMLPQSQLDRFMICMHIRPVLPERKSCPIRSLTVSLSGFHSVIRIILLPRRSSWDIPPAIWTACSLF